jgi:hypothetical protein
LVISLSRTIFLSIKRKPSRLCCQLAIEGTAAA